MITMILIGFGVLVAIAAIVGVIDASRSADRRFIASERRHEWESRQAYHQAGPSWADEDDD